MALLPPAPWQADDDRFAALLRRDTPLLQLCADCEWAEGPVWLAQPGCLLWSDIPRNRMLRWREADGVTVFRAPSDFANGHASGREGRLLSCEHGTRRVTRTEHDGRRTVLVDRFRGHRLNSPNDLVVARDGSVWFTDPTYGIDSDREGYRAEPEYGGRHVFRFDPACGVLQVIADDFVQPNGLALSADERTLYVVDTGGTHVDGGPRHIRALSLGDGARVRASRLFAEIDCDFPDGLALDEAGRVWASAGDGVHCFDIDGERLGRLLLPEPAANLCFGGVDHRRLFIAATRSLYAVDLSVRGLLPPEP